MKCDIKMSSIILVVMTFFIVTILPIIFNKIRKCDTYKIVANLFDSNNSWLFVGTSRAQIYYDIRV